MDNAIRRVAIANRQRAAEAAFRHRLAEFDTELLEPFRWRGATVRYACRCPVGHKCSVSPHKLGRGQRPCTICPKPVVAEAERKFRELVAAAGGQVVGIWVNNKTPIEVICRFGHPGHPHPTSVIQGGGICRECAGKSPEAAERRFRELVALHGGTYVGPWTRSSQGIHCICAVGHECWPQLGSLVKGQGLCQECGGTSPKAAEREFRRRLADADAVLLEPAYKGTNSRHRIICPQNHVTTVTPAIVRERGVYCDSCPTARSKASERAFIIALAKHGATYVGPWTGCDRPVALICAAGHHVTTRPINVARGNGPCRLCAGKVWDAFYVVASAGAVKFGITSGDPRPRLRDHANRGLTNVVHLTTSLPGTVAPDTEKAVKAALALAGEKPLLGREYFDISCLGLIVDVAESWLRVAA